MKINNKPEPSLTSSKITRAKHEAAAPRAAQAAFTCNNNVGDASTVLTRSLNNFNIRENHFTTMPASSQRPSASKSDVRRRFGSLL